MSSYFALGLLKRTIHGCPFSDQCRKERTLALITKIVRQALQAHASHTEAECTYDIVTNDHGARFLQLDTYGSKARQIQGKKSQSLRFSPEGLMQLKRIIEEHGL
jgi:hypothetical protein